MVVENNLVNVLIEYQVIYPILNYYYYYLVLLNIQLNDVMLKGNDQHLLMSLD
jgi:hypothetical protein